MNEDFDIEEIVSDLIDIRDRIIPIIGDGCFEVMVDGGTSVPLQKHIVERLSNGEITVENCENGYYGMTRLYKDYFNGNESEFKKKVKYIVRQGLENNTIRLKPVVKDFLKAGKFEVVVTTNVFHILENEISEEHHHYNTKVFVPNASNPEENLITPTVYKIFGDYSAADAVLTEDGLLKYLHYLNIPGVEKGFGPSPFIKYIKNKKAVGKVNSVLMPIGCDNLPNWIFRFLWYPISSKILENSTEGDVWATYVSDEIFIKFLEYNSFQMFQSDAQSNVYDSILEAFTSKMRSESKKARSESDEMKEVATEKMKVDWQDDDEWDYFLSYAKENEEIVNRLYHILTNNCGKRVWMDNRQINIGRYWDIIQHGIEHSRRYIFVITEDYLRKANEPGRIDENGVYQKSGVYTEIEKINKAVVKQEKDINDGGRYSVPLIHKGTTVNVSDLSTHVQHTRELDGALLEKLYLFEEYHPLKTKDLFDGMQTYVFNEDNMKDILKIITK